MKYTFPSKYRCIDAHNHLFGKDGKFDVAEADAVLRTADLIGIERVCVSLPLLSECPTPAEFREANDVIAAAVKYSKRFIGFCFVNPGYGREAAAEIRRCVVKHGFSGIKLYFHYRICDPAQAPVMEEAASLGIPVLMHACKITEPKMCAAQPNLSAAEHFLQALKMFPDTIFIQGHIGGGGDWEWNLRHLEQVASNNYYIDLSGSVVDAGIAAKTVAAVGVDRVLFATDMSYEDGAGKVLDAGFTESQLKKILGDNMRKLLARRKG